MAEEMGRMIVVPDEEIVEPIHLSVGPGQMLCGAESGIGVFEWDVARVTCPACKEAAKNDGYG